MQLILTVILFILKLKFPSNRPISNIITQRYGHNTLLLFRKWEREHLKHEKAKCQLIFLNKCKTYNTFPKFLYFKLYNKNLHNSDLYKKFQHKLLTNEIALKKRNINRLEKVCFGYLSELKKRFSFLDFYYLKFFVNKTCSITISKIKQIHKRKLSNLGINNEIQPLDPNKVIFNLSNRVLTPKEKWLLSFGLNFKLPTFKLNFCKYFFQI